jgi:hypothetical protein
MPRNSTHAGVVGLYISYAVPVFFHAFASRGEGSNWVPGAFNLGSLSKPLALISSAWITLACALFVLPQVCGAKSICSTCDACLAFAPGWVLCVMSALLPVAAPLHCQWLPSEASSPAATNPFPQVYPVTSRNLNYAPVTVGCVVVVAGSLWLLSARKWFEGPVGDPNVSCALHAHLACWLD